MKSFLIAGLASLAGAMMSVAQAQVTVHSADVIDYGIYRIELSNQHLPMPSAGAGAVQPASRAVLVTQTNQIPAILKTTFGVQFVLKGNPIGALAAVEIIVKHPAFKKPNGEKTGPVDRVPWAYRVGEPVGYTYTFDNDWEMEPGTWSIEVWHGDTRLVGKEFMVLTRTR